jgi:hypothetical protein
MSENATESERILRRRQRSGAPRGCLNIDLAWLCRRGMLLYNYMAPQRRI